jgi:hypothetical protein
MTVTAQEQLNEILEELAKSLDIPDELHEEAVRKYEELGHWLEERDSAIGRREPKIYSQGSFQLGTVIKPLSDLDEYDIDLVYERDIRKGSTSQLQLKAEAGVHLESFVDFLTASHRDAPQLEPGRRCWTLNYPDQFHMDVLPAIPNDEQRAAGLRRSETSIEITDHSVRNWHTSNPAGYADWFRNQMLVELRHVKERYARNAFFAKSIVVNEAMVKNAAEMVPDYKVKTPLQQAIQILKRHRDIHFKGDDGNRPASIIITTLAAKAYQNNASLLETLILLVRDMPKHIESREIGGVAVSVVMNPVNDLENFADRWQDEKHPERELRFRGWLEKVRSDIADALKGGGIPRVVNQLGASFGESMILKAAGNLGQAMLKHSTSGGLSMVKGTGSLVVASQTAPSIATTPVRRHTFYGDSINHENP